jgi:hypothetical protein
MDVSKWPWKTWFQASAANAAIGGVAVACSSLSVACSAEDGGVVVPKKPQADASTAMPAPTVPSQTSCPGAVDLSAVPAWKVPSPVAPGACSTNDLAILAAQIENSNTTWTAVYDAIPSASCRGCVFSKRDDPNWQVAVWDPDMASGIAFVNYGACFALAPGGSDACGAAIQDDQFCVEAACAQTCTDQQGCVSEASMGVCAAQDGAITTSCGTQLTQLNAACGQFIDAVKLVCGGGAPDAAGDATTDAPDEGG